MLKCRKSFLGGRRYRRHHDDERQAEVAHDGASHESSAVVVSVYGGRHNERDAVGPRQRRELIPPTTDHQRHEESEYERNGDQIVVLLAVDRQSFEHSAIIVDHHDCVTCLLQYLEVTTIGLIERYDVIVKSRSEWPNFIHINYTVNKSSTQHQ